MRLTDTLDLGDKKIVTVRELRVADVRNAIANAEELKSVDFTALLQEGGRLDGLLQLFGDCIELPKGVKLDDLTFSDIEAVWAKFMAVNAPFFRLASLAGAALPAMDSPASTAPVAP